MKTRVSFLSVLHETSLSNSVSQMILPIRDVMATEVSKATRFTHHGLTVIVKGHEELFFEFSAEARRSAIVRLLDRQMEDVRGRIVAGENKAPSASRRDALILEEFSSAYPHNSELEPTLDRTTDSLPAIMFTSGSSTFLTFKPKESMRFTILTIGSRGDVQPYIALAKGLMADGHRVKIATHAEFKGWIESVPSLFFFYNMSLIRCVFLRSTALNMATLVATLPN